MRNGNANILQCSCLRITFRKSDLPIEWIFVIFWTKEEIIFQLVARFLRVTSVQFIFISYWKSSGDEGGGVKIIFKGCHTFTNVWCEFQLFLLRINFGDPIVFRILDTFELMYQMYQKTIFWRQRVLQRLSCLYEFLVWIWVVSPSKQLWTSDCISHSGYIQAYVPKDYILTSTLQRLSYLCECVMRISIVSPSNQLWTSDCISHSRYIQAHVPEDYILPSTRSSKAVVPLRMSGTNFNLFCFESILDIRLYFAF